jgi:cold shock CspA family protein
VPTKMTVHKYLARGMYGFLRDSLGREVFFHLGSFRPRDEETEPIPPIPGEDVEVDVDFDSGEGGKAPRASRVIRLTTPVAKTGIVDMFDATSGYGFVRCGDEMFFLHKSEIRDGKVPLIDNQVHFYPGVREGKSRACHATVLRSR